MNEKKNIQEPWNNIKKCNMLMFRITEEREKGTEGIFEVIMAEIFSK